MEETKWLTKGKIITFVVLILLIAGIIIGVVVHKNNLKKGNDIVFLWNKNADFHKINFNIINTEIIYLLNKAKMV